jgi:transcriptional regulator with XRE-family HTH domain
MDMDGQEMRARRKALGIRSQAEFAVRLGLSRDHVGRMERGDDPILPRTAAAVRSLKPEPLGHKPTTRDPIERIVEQALIDAGIRYATDDGGGTESRLDFRLLDYDIELEVKRFYTARSGEQLARAPNVILIQGDRAARFFAAAIRSGDFFELMKGDGK